MRPIVFVVCSGSLLLLSFWLAGVELTLFLAAIVVFFSAWLVVTGRISTTFDTIQKKKYKNFCWMLGIALMIAWAYPIFSSENPSSAQISYATQPASEVAPDSNAASPATNPAAPTVPANLQGVWAIDCAGAADGSSQFGYNVYGPNLDLSSIPSLGSSTTKVVDVVQQNGAVAVSEDNAYDPNNDQAAPNISIMVYQALSDTQIELFSSFTEAGGVAPGTNSVINKCRDNQAFSDAISQAGSASAPSQAEIDASHAAFAAMPAIMGIKWNP
jgi:hypothetical protein